MTQIFDCLSCGAHFSEMEQTRNQYKNNQCPCCGDENLKLVEIKLNVDAFEIDIETLANADWSKDNWATESARITVIRAVIKALDPDSRKRFMEYQERNEPCK